MQSTPPRSGSQVARPIPIRAVVVTMFEIDRDSGDRPGEFQTWVERLPLPEKIPFRQGHLSVVEGQRGWPLHQSHQGAPRHGRLKDGQGLSGRALLHSIYCGTRDHFRPIGFGRHLQMT
jgi:hypothetical protein